MSFANISIVLVEPQGPRNIGSICRAMKNFGFTDLRLVNPSTDHLGKEARDMAVKANELLDNATIFKDLATAVADCPVALGTTRRYGRYRVDFLFPQEAATLINRSLGETKTALVFGREKHGLRTEELELCQRYITIPTNEEHPSMNLAQAVCLMIYEVAKQHPDKQEMPPGREDLASGKDLEIMYLHMRQSLLDIGYLNPQNPDHILRTFRRIFGRAQLDHREVNILQGLWSKIDWLNSELGKNRQE